MLHPNLQAHPLFPLIPFGPREGHERPLELLEVIPGYRVSFMWNGKHFTDEYLDSNSKLTPLRFMILDESHICTRSGNRFWIENVSEGTTTEE